jgi:hypothetical protein
MNGKSQALKIAQMKVKVKKLAFLASHMLNLYENYIKFGRFKSM